MSKVLSSLMIGGLGLAAVGVSSSADAAVISATAEATVNSGDTGGDGNVDEASVGRQQVKFNTSFSSARHVYWQFDLSGQTPDLSQSATFSITLQDDRAQVVQLWALDQAYPTFSADITWNNAQANDTTTNDLLTVGALTATQIGGAVEVPGTNVGDVINFTLPTLGDYVIGNELTLVLTGVDDAGASISNNSGGLRIALNSGELDFAEVPEPGSLALLGLGGLLIARRRRA